MLEIASRLRHWRDERGYTQQQAAELLGCTNRRYSNWESNRQGIDLRGLIAFCSHGDIHWLLTGIRTPDFSSTVSYLTKRCTDLESELEELRLFSSEFQIISKKQF